MKSTGSLPIRENSRMRRVRPENFERENLELDELVCIILLRIEFWAACAAQNSMV